MSPLFGFIGLGMPEMIVLAVIGVLIFGRKLPEVGRYLGKGIVEFKKGIKGIEDDVDIGSSSSSSNSASPALVALRLLKALERRIDGDAAAREEERKFEITGAGDKPKTMRVVPAKGGVTGEEGESASNSKGGTNKGGGKGFGRKGKEGGGAPAA